MYVHQIQISLLVYIPPLSHYIVYHNATSDGGHGIIVYDTSVTINVTNDQFQANAVYYVQVVAVNVIGQGPVNETTLSEFWVISGKEILIKCALISHITSTTC